MNLRRRTHLRSLQAILVALLFLAVSHASSALAEEPTATESPAVALSEQRAFAGTLDPNVTALNLSDAEKQQLLDFLNALDGQELDPALITAPSLPP